MQLKKLTIHNIASIEDATIDFSGLELGKAPIFLICGETGAGKTTILDSICLALYGETPRMTSVSKEDLELMEPSDNRTERYYSNDNSQLLHRGAGEGFSKLLFMGNDGKDYEAMWEVHRAHNKAHKRLLRPTRLLYAVDGSYSENRIAEIKGKIIELTGLEYDQFCRTVMLAQGEFTKFLKSNKSEKSEILEKLTGTEIYSKLGIRIAENYNKVRGEWQQMKEDIDRVTLLTDEAVQEMENRRGEIVNLVKEKTEVRQKAIDKLTWLLTAAKNEESRRVVIADIAKLEESMQSESFQNDRILVRDYEASGEGRAVLANLKKNEEKIKVRQESLPGLLKDEEQAAALEKEAMEKCEVLEKDAALTEEAIDKIDVEKLTKEYHALTNRDKALSDLLTQTEKLKGDEKALEILEGQQRDVVSRRDDNLKKAETLRGPAEDAERELAEWTEKLSKAEMSVSDMVKDLRSRLKQGEHCPVCGALVDKEITDEYFESLLAPMRDAKKRAEVMYLTLKSNEEAAAKLVASDEKVIKRLQGRIRNASETLGATRETTEQMIKKVGLETLPTNEIETACEKERQALSGKLEALRERQKVVEGLQKDLKKLRKKLKDASAAAEKVKVTAANVRLRLKETNAEIKGLETTRESLWENMRLFFITHPEVSMPRLTKLAAYSQNEIRILKERLDAAEDRLKLEKGKLEGIMSQVAAHEQLRPEFEENENKESLEKLRNEIEVEVKKLSEETGRIVEALDRDNKLRKDMESKRRILAQAREKLEKWEGLYNRLGDLKGVKFRAIAQSFILRSLLENANVYMRSFNDRYTLTCNPGTLAILVKDGYKPSEPQPASILSGGESFMASLSLALALSNLRSGGMSVDILFIDEGFGTLSAEYLGNVMDTLEKLHQIGGRKVGLISHVAEMKERIPVQIRVHRESPALSRVDIIETY